jgi:hypothetical protein
MQKIYENKYIPIDNIRIYLYNLIRNKVEIPKEVKIMTIINERMAKRTTDYTAEEVADYIIGSYAIMYNPNTHDYFLFQNPNSGKLEYLGTGSANAIEVNATVDYDSEYLNDENPQRFYDETERKDHAGFMKVCQELADKLNENLKEME